MTPAGPPAPAPLEGTALLDLFQETFVALTGIPTALVRPRFQNQAPDVPDAGSLWMTFTIDRRPSDTFPVLVHQNVGDGQDYFQRQETLVIMCSFYDNGSTGQAYASAAQLRDGLAIPQNIEALLDGGNINWGYCNEIVPLPSLLKTLWLYRADLEIHFRRQIDRVYRTLTVLTGDIDLKANPPETTQIIERIIEVTPDSVLP